MPYEFAWNKFLFVYSLSYGANVMCFASVLEVLYLGVINFTSVFFSDYGHYIFMERLDIFLLLVIDLISLALQYYGVKYRNHFLLLPFLVTAIAQLSAVVLANVFVLLFASHWFKFDVESAILTVQFIITAYAVFIVTLLYREFSDAYHFNLKMTHFHVASMKFSELAMNEEQDVTDTEELEAAAVVTIS